MLSIKVDIYRILLCTVKMGRAQGETNIQTSAELNICKNRIQIPLVHTTLHMNLEQKSSRARKMVFS